MDYQLGIEPPRLTATAINGYQWVGSVVVCICRHLKRASICFLAWIWTSIGLSGLVTPANDITQLKSVLSAQTEAISWANSIERQRTKIKMKKRKQVPPTRQQTKCTLICCLNLLKFPD